MKPSVFGCSVASEGAAVDVGVLDVDGFAVDVGVPDVDGFVVGSTTGATVGVAVGVSVATGSSAGLPNTLMQALFRSIAHHLQISPYCHTLSVFCEISITLSC